MSIRGGAGADGGGTGAFGSGSRAAGSNPTSPQEFTGGGAHGSGEPVAPGTTNIPRAATAPSTDPARMSTDET